MMDDEIARRILRLSPEARALFFEAQRRGEETEFMVPPDELLVDLEQRMAALSPEDLSEFVGLHEALVRRGREEAVRLEAEALESEGFLKLIERTKEVDRRAGRPVNEKLTTGEAVARLKEAGELDSLTEAYYEAVKHEIVWVTKKTDEED
jgi:hypothetical protein